MAKKTATVRRRRQPVGRSKTTLRSGPSWHLPLDRKNFIFFGASLAVIIIGFALMATGITDDPAKHQETWNNPVAIAIAPIVLVIAYCVLIPLAIMKKDKQEPSEE